MAESLSSVGRSGILSGMLYAVESAGKINAGFESGEDSLIVDGIIGLQAGKMQVEASAVAVKIEQKMSEAILDILA